MPLLALARLADDPRYVRSPKGTSILESSCPLEAVHMTRGDSDGPGDRLPSR